MYFRPEVIDNRTVPNHSQVRRRTVRVGLSQAGIRLDVEWTILPSESEMFSKIMTFSGFQAETLTWNGRPVPARSQTKQSSTWELDAFLNKPTVMKMSGLIPNTDPAFKQALGRGVSLELLGATTQSVRLEPDSSWFLHASKGGGGIMLDGVLWHSTPKFLLKLSKEPDKGRNISGKGIVRVGMGVTALTTKVVGEARFDWLSGTRASNLMRVTVPPDMPPFDIQGPHVKTWGRRGNLVSIEFSKQAPRRTLVLLRWEQPLEGKDLEHLSLPHLRVLDVEEQISSVQFASSGEVDVVPSLRQGAPVSSEELPDYGRNLIQAAPVSSFLHRGSLSGDVHLLRYSPADAPPVIVDVAQTHLALSEEGRALGRTRLTVRNETATHLEVCIPTGVHLLGVTVSSQSAVLRKSGECIQIQLPRSVESVKGGLAFPVDLIFRTNHQPWHRNEHRRMAWYTIRNAPVAVHRTTISLPPTYRSDTTKKPRYVVDSFTEGEGLSYGYGLEGAKENKADELFQEAVSDWMRNDFESAKQQLGALGELGASNENIVRLQSNLDAVLEKKSANKSGQSAVVTRRVRQQAMVRAGKRKMRQMDAMDEAELALSSGDYKRAKTLYEEAEEITSTLESLENDESVEEKTNANKISLGLKRAKQNIESNALLLDRDSHEDEMGGGIPQGKSFSGWARSGRAAPMPERTMGANSNVSMDSPVHVSATRIDLVIPNWGESIQYQQLLLSPGEAPETIIFAKKTRGK